MDRKIQVFISNLSQNVSVNSQLTLLEGLLKAKVEIDHSCGGYGTCGTCCVQVEQGSASLPPRESPEAEMAIERGFADNERLCCQIRPVDGLRLNLQKRDLNKSK